jgi:hypothetical protein
MTAKLSQMACLSETKEGGRLSSLLVGLQGLEPWTDINWSLKLCLI